ncbi:hypothetical protein BVY03_02425 [bacterium K02(2017)]|nr:hypothetical protein BVY03_02425 [bacterium K02(2017)]
MFANRMNYIEASSIRRMFEMASKMKNPINFSLGLPDFDVPEVVKEAAIKAIRDGKNQYTITSGIPEFKHAIQTSLLSEGVKAEQVVATAGASGGLILALLVLADENTEVLIPEPCFLAYEQMVKLAGAKVRWISTYPKLKLSADQLDQEIQKSKQENPQIKNRLFIYNSPVNPTGIAYTGDEISGLAQITKKHNVRVIADEVYDRFSYDFKHESWLKHDLSAVLVRTFGKTWGMTGWRAGYVAGPADVLDHMTTLQQFTYVCVNTPTQWACIEALKVSVEDKIVAYAKKRNLVYDALKDHLELIKPQGAFYAFPQAPFGDTAAFLKKCIKHEILIVPGEAFSQKNSHFRLSFALSDDDLSRGLEALIKVIKEN